MNIRLTTTKVFAIFSLFFAVFISAEAQTDASIYQLQPGTRILVRLDNEINSKVLSVNDTFTVKVSEPLKVSDVVLLPIGTRIEGRITKVGRAAIGGRNGILEVSFETLWSPGGGRQKIEGKLVNPIKAESSVTEKTLAIVGGTAIGAIIGAVSKTSNGLLIGAGIGAGAGTGAAFLKKGKDAKIAAGEEFEIELTKNVTLPPEDY